MPTDVRVALGHGWGPFEPPAYGPCAACDSRWRAFALMGAVGFAAGVAASATAVYIVLCRV